MNPEGYRTYVDLVRQYENFKLGNTAFEIVGVLSAKPMGAAPLTRVLNNEYRIAIERPNVRKQLIRLQSMGLISQKGTGRNGERPYRLTDLGWFFVIYNNISYSINLLISSSKGPENMIGKDFLLPYFTRETLVALHTNLPFDLHVTAFLNQCAKLILDTAKDIPFNHKREVHRLKVPRLSKEQFDNMYSEMLKFLAFEIESEFHKTILDILEECRFSDNVRNSGDPQSQMLQVLIHDKKFNAWVDDAISSVSKNIEFYQENRKPLITS